MKDFSPRHNWQDRPAVSDGCLLGLVLAVLLDAVVVLAFVVLSS